MIAQDGNELKVYTLDEYVAALHAATTYYGRKIVQVKVVPIRVGFVGRVTVTTEDENGRTRSTQLTFAPNCDVYVQPSTFGE